MKIKLKVTSYCCDLSLLTPITLDYIVHNTNEICFTNREIQLHLSTLLLDENGDEIYENDILSDSQGNRFKVIFSHGAFFGHSLNEMMPYKNIPLYLLQANGIIPAKLIER